MSDKAFAKPTSVGLFEIVPATIQHARAIDRNARPEDADEIYAASGKSCFEAMVKGLRITDQPFTAMLEGKPICMFGIAPYSRVYNSGVPWMIGSTLLDKHPAMFAKHSKDLFYQLAAPFAELENYVDVRNITAIKWLRWLGFEFDPPAPYGFLQLPFHRFYMKA